MGCSGSVEESAVSLDGQATSAERLSSEHRGRNLPKRFIARMHRGNDDRIGASFGNTPSGAVIFLVHAGGMLDNWNKRRPDLALCPGFIVEAVNGVQGFWNVLDAMRSRGPLAFQVATEPPASAGPGWFEKITGLVNAVEQSGNKGPLMLRLQPQDPSSTDENRFTTLPSVKAGDCGVDNCAICLKDLKPHEIVAQLPCKHAYHPVCAARWLTQETNGRAQRCPLCLRKMVSTPEGEVCAVTDPSS